MYSLRKLGTALHKWSYASIRAYGGPSSVWRLVEEGGRYTCHVIVFARGKSKNAAMPDEERCSALSRFLQKKMQQHAPMPNRIEWRVHSLCRLSAPAARSVTVVANPRQQPRRAAGACGWSKAQ
jgi:hypothetical protein